MKKVIFGALLTLGVVVFVGCADKAATNEGASKAPAAKCGAGKDSKCGSDKKDTKCGGEAKSTKCGSDKNSSKCGSSEAAPATKCGAENNGKCGTQK